MVDTTNIETASLPEEVSALIQSLRNSVETAENKRAKAEHERNEYKKLYELVLLELERLRRQLFGKKSERVADEQLVLQFMQVAEAVKAMEEKLEKEPMPNSTRKSGNEKKKTPHGRQQLPEHLPLERIELPPPVEVTEEPDAYKKIGEDVSETLERRPATLVRVQIVRPKFAKKADEDAGVIAAELPSKPIDKGLAGPGLLSHVIVSKYLDHLPLNRQEGIFARENITLGRSTLCGWIKQCAELAHVVVEAMTKDAMNAHCIAIDATGVLVQAPDKCHRGHFFVLIADRDHVLYFYKRYHDGDAAKELLGDYKGYILADAHVIYDQLYRDNTERIEVGCYSHCRRYFYDAIGTEPDLAMEGIRQIGKLFEIEREIKERSPNEKKRIRQEKSKPITDAFFEWCELQWPTAIEHTPIYDALRYARNQKEALRRFLEDGRLSIHNNFSELSLRQEVIGRRNWIFLGSEDGGEWNCIFSALIASCKLHDIEPWAYLRDLFILLPDWPRSRVLELSPKFWKQTLEQTDAQKRLAANPFYRVTALIK